MIFSMGRLSRLSNRMSRLVRMPTSLFVSSVMGRPEIRCSRMTSKALLIRSWGRRVMGSTIIPLSWRLTLSTSSAWASTDRLRWMMPIPPCWARAMAIRDSVTVSMAELTTGMLSGMLRQSLVATRAPAGTTSDLAGTMRTSSKVRASRIVSSSMLSPPSRFFRLPGIMDRACLALCPDAPWGCW